ncbi:MAG: hypothetical protein H6728_10810 [Myxococcales bacterium]|nr:hypothetical protein [Myxococcales bacterium]MCB9643550.1 hypothetical protein [Myxococcales bacterium]
MTKGTNVQFFWELGSDAGLKIEVLRERCLALLFLFAWSNLTDDLVDKEADYLLGESSEKAGPIALYVLRCLADAVALQAAEIPTEVWVQANLDLAACACVGFEEIRETPWTRERWLSVGEGIAGLQFSAYLRILWCGTPLAAWSEEVGKCLGMISHFACDRKSEDPRLRSLLEEEQREIASWIEEKKRWLKQRAEEAHLQGILMWLRNLPEGGES